MLHFSVQKNLNAKVALCFYLHKTLIAKVVLHFDTQKNQIAPVALHFNIFKKCGFSCAALKSIQKICPRLVIVETRLQVREMWHISDDWTYRTAAYFQDDEINLQFHFSESSEVPLVVKSHVCVSCKDGARSAVATTKKTVFLGSK